MTRKMALILVVLLGGCDPAGTLDKLDDPREYDGWIDTDGPPRDDELPSWPDDDDDETRDPVGGQPGPLVPLDPSDADDTGDPIVPPYDPEIPEDPEEDPTDPEDPGPSDTDPPLDPEDPRDDPPGEPEDPPKDPPPDRCPDCGKDKDRCGHRHCDGRSCKEKDRCGHRRCDGKRCRYEHRTEDRRDHRSCKDRSRGVHGGTRHGGKRWRR